MAYTTIDNPEAYFQTVLYTGNGSTQTISYPNADADLDADMVWIKQRSQETSHTIFDSVRGVQEAIFTNNTNAETTRTDAVSAFGTDSFNLGANGDLNANTETHVAWCWKESATAGFDIITWTVPSSGSTTISHSLSAVPQMIISKSRSNVTDWEVYHHKTGNDNTNQLNTTAAANDNNAYNDTDPTSSVFSVTAAGFGADRTIVSYAFAEKQGFSKFGSYTGNANADGAFVYTGFRPAFVLLKNSTGANGWEMRDNKRPGYNLSSGTLAPSSSDAETTGEGIDIFSNGFKLRASGNGQNGANTYIYMAFAEAPFVNSNGVPCNAR